MAMQVFTKWHHLTLYTIVQQCSSVSEMVDFISDNLICDLQW